MHCALQMHDAPMHLEQKLSLVHVLRATRGSTSPPVADSAQFQHCERSGHSFFFSFGATGQYVSHRPLGQSSCAEHFVLVPEHVAVWSHEVLLL